MLSTARSAHQTGGVCMLADALKGPQEQPVGQSEADCLDNWQPSMLQELAQSPHAASQPGFGTAQGAEAAVHVRKHVPKPDLLRAVVDITIFA